jgi:ribosomal protein S27E
VSEWVILENPAFAGRKPTILQAACHDRSPFVTIRCRCGYELHQHESRVAMAPAGAEIAMRCLGCGELLLFPPGFFAGAFATLRQEGWIE